MKLIGKLTENVEKAENEEQAKELIAEAGMELTDEELDQIVGGSSAWPHTLLHTLLSLSLLLSSHSQERRRSPRNH